jgi:hypothetical protein
MQNPQELAQTADTDFDPDADRLREECGVFGIFGHPDAAAITALGLHASSHSTASGSIPSAASASSATPSRAVR